MSKLVSAFCLRCLFQLANDDHLFSAVEVGKRCAFICVMLADMISFSEIAGVRLELEEVLETL
jgi:hypothetical protein